MCWCDLFKYVPEYRATLFLQGELGQLYLLRSCYVSWCLVYSSCCDFLTLSFVCYMSIDCSGGLAQRVSAQILIYRVTSSGSPCPCAWHQQSLMLHVLAALCMTTYSMHTLVSCEASLYYHQYAGSPTSILPVPNVYICCLPSEIGKAEFCGPL